MDFDSGRLGSSSGHDLITACIYDKYLVGPSIRPICTRCCFTMTDMIQVCSNFDRVGGCIAHTRPDEIAVDPSPSSAS